MGDDADAAIPVVLIAREFAFVLARLDHDKAGATDHDDRDHRSAVARLVPREHEVVGRELDSQVRGDPVCQPPPRVAAEHSGHSVSGEAGGQA
jgi:hypothetical protein